MMIKFQINFLIYLSKQVSLSEGNIKTGIKKNI